MRKPDWTQDKEHYSRKQQWHQGQASKTQYWKHEEADWQQSSWSSTSATRTGRSRGDRDAGLYYPSQEAAPGGTQSDASQGTRSSADESISSWFARK